MKPIIGITPAHNIKENRFFISNDYLSAIIDNGGIPLILPPCGADGIGEQLKQTDGLLLSGGGDINPLLLGEEPHPCIGESSLARDRHELALAKTALDLHLPLMGICRGIQIMAAAGGGLLHQDISGVSKICHDQKALRTEPTHSVRIAQNTLLRQITGEEKIWVNSLHHQAVKDPGPLFHVSAQSEDGIIEAMEGKNGFMIGIQWHGETLYRHDPIQRKIFQAFINAAGAE